MPVRDHSALRILVAGCGSIGSRHIRNLRALGVREVFVHDLDEGRCRAAAAESGVQSVVRWEEAWERRPRIALIAAPSNLHLPLALEAAEHGCDLFIEKPLAHAWDGVSRLEEAIAHRGLIAMVACNMRFHPGPATVKRLLQERMIGTPLAARIQTGSYLPTWRPAQDYRQSYSASPEWGGAILDCIHEIDLALWYFGAASLESAVVLPADSLGLTTDGLAELVLRHNSGVVTNVHLNFIQRDYRRTCQVIGSEGTLYWDFAARCVDVYGPDGKLRQSFREPEGWELNQMYLEELGSFLEAVSTRRETVNPLAGGAAVLRIALAARQRAVAPRP
jgi:predicted dehydrogenase